MKSALIIGAGTGLSASFARKLARNGYAVHLAARSAGKVEDLVAEIGAVFHMVDGTDPDAVEALVAGIPGDLRVACYNPSARVRGPIAELDPNAVAKAVEVTATGAFNLGRAAAARMLSQNPDERGVKGTILFTGASAGVKGFAQSAPFAMGKFAQRGLAQAMARELHPKGIHVCWINIDGGIRNAARPERTEDPDNPDAMLDPDAIAQEYMNLIGQHRSAWSDELALRPWVERF